MRKVDRQNKILWEYVWVLYDYIMGTHRGGEQQGHMPSLELENQVENKKHICKNCNNYSFYTIKFMLLNKNVSYIIFTNLWYI